MQITRFADARRYDAPKHFDMRSLRLQGFDLSAAKFAWVGVSHFLPQGGAQMDAGPLEKIYVVLEGAVTIELADGTTHVLHPLDSCHIPGGEARSIRNDGNAVASMLVIMPHPEPRP
ncbi:MAG TPA: cupin domain-containing protein [Steroidobacteraceae bacterium]|jgi:quercetin dioxygenase-like cupin family protein